jgi:hypothetical protein
MNKLNNKSIIAALITLVVLLIYLGSGAFIDSGIVGKVNENGWMGNNNWRILPAICTLSFGVFVGWLLFQKAK